MFRGNENTWTEKGIKTMGSILGTNQHSFCVFETISKLKDTKILLRTSAILGLSPSFELPDCVWKVGSSTCYLHGRPTFEVLYPQFKLGVFCLLWAF